MKKYCKNCDEINKKYYKIYSCTIDSDGNHHSFNDEPAIIYVYGDKFWYKHGKLHRENFPAFVEEDGYVEWYYNGIKSLFTKSRRENNIILLNFNYMVIPSLLHLKNKPAIILEKIKSHYIFDKKKYPIYLCLVDNIKIYVICTSGKL